MKTRRANRTETDSPGLLRWKAVRWGESAPEEGFVVVEAPLEVAVGDHLIAVLMQTPGMEKELGIGYCLGEGILPSAEAIAAVDVEKGTDTPLRVVIRPHSSDALAVDALHEPRLIRSGCGSNAAGSWGCTLPPLGQGITVTDAALQRSMKTLAASQEAYRVAGGIHAAGVFTSDGEAVVVCEDIGRHNTVDKAMGHCILAGIPLADKFLLGTGRASYEFVTKSARMSVSLVASLSSPTSLSVSLADVLNQTLVGYLRSNRFIIYTHPWRVQTAAASMRGVRPAD